MDKLNPRLQFNDEVCKGIEIINDVIKKYNIVDPAKNVCTMWENGRLVICFSQQYWPSDKSELQHL